MARVAPKIETAIRVVVGSAARAARSGLRDPSVSRATISAWCADHSEMVRSASRRQILIDTNHSISQDASRMPSPVSDPAMSDAPPAFSPTHSPTIATSQAISALMIATTMRRVSTASRAKAHRVRSPVTQRSTELKARPRYIATRAANRSGRIDPCADTDADSGLTMTKAAAPVTAAVHDNARPWNRAFGSAASLRRLRNTTRPTKARPNRVIVRAASKYRPASSAPTSTASKEMVVERHGRIGVDGLLRTSRVRAALRVRKIACGANTLMMTRPMAAGRVAGPKADWLASGSPPAAITVKMAVTTASAPVTMHTSPTTPTRNCTWCSASLRRRNEETG